MTPDGRLWLWTGSAWIDDDYMPASEDEDGSEVADIWPHLADPVTVNSLLGAGEVIKLEHPKGWAAYIGEHSAYGNDTHTEAICRAWIAAHKGDK